jgi:hypothetical protein
MASEVQICNMALGHIGAAAEIQSLSEATEEAKYSNLYYNDIRDSVLRQHPWNFATTYVVLADLGSPPTGWDYRYRYPVDCHRALNIVKAAKTDPEIEFDVGSDGSSGRVILTDQATATLRYTAKVTDPNAFDALFIHALSWALAVHLAEPITSSQAKKKDAAAAYAGIMLTAKATDSNEGEVDGNSEADWIAARA